MNDTKKQFEDLVGGLIDGELTDEQMSQLIELTSESPEFQKQLQDQLEAADMLAQANDILRQSRSFLEATLSRLDDGEFVSTVRETIDKTEAEPAKWRVPWWAGSLAVLVAAIGVWAVFQFGIKPSPNPPEVAQLEGFHGEVQWTGDGGRVVRNFDKGLQVQGGTLETLAADAWARLKFDDGTTVTVFGRSMLTVSEDSQKELHLRSGSLSASVVAQPEGKPMLIQTPSATLQVVGTQFNVVAERELTRLSVNEGRVRIERISDGQVAEVRADEQIVSGMDESVALKAFPRPKPKKTWRSELPQGVLYGKWVDTPGQDGGSLRSAPVLLRCHPDGPILIFLAAMSVTRSPAPPVILTEESVIRFRGRLNSSREVIVGLTTTYLRRGFAGKYLATRKVDVGNEGGEFEFEIPLTEFRPETESFPKSPIGLALFNWWCLTVEKDAGLEVSDVELRLKTDASNPASVSQPAD